jgi:hypothetical protein
MKMVAMKAKYMGYCPCCKKIITVGAAILWEKGNKPIHAECNCVTVEQIATKFIKEHKNIEIRFIGEKDGIYCFEGVRKWNQTRYEIKFDKSGERVSESV